MKIKNTVYTIEHFRVEVIIILMILFTLILFFSIYIQYHENEFVVEVFTINTRDIDKIKSDKTDIIGEQEINDLRDTIHLKEYVGIPKKIDKYKVIGKIEIPKIQIEKYILEETNEKSLKLSVTKICGPDINKTGNFCIAGHNYQNTFGKLKELEKGDIIRLIDTYNRTVEYRVYHTEQVAPNNTECLSQETNGDREITLITCTLGAVKRVIVKAIEIYD